MYMYICVTEGINTKLLIEISSEEGSGNTGVHAVGFHVYSMYVHNT